MHIFKFETVIPIYKKGLVDSDIQSRIRDIEEKKSRYTKNIYPAGILALFVAISFFFGLWATGQALEGKTDFYGVVALAIVLFTVFAYYSYHFYKKAKKSELK